MSKHSSASSQDAGSAVVSRRVALGLLMLIIVFWGANWTVMEVGLTYIPPLTFAATRMVLGASILAAIAAGLGQL